MGKIFDWDKEKNQKLSEERGISFEAIVAHIEAGNIRDIIAGKGTYKHQKQFIIEVNKYIYIIPFVEDSQKIFLKTIIPSGKLTKKYILGDIQ